MHLKLLVNIPKQRKVMLEVELIHADPGHYQNPTSLEYSTELL